MAGRHDFTTPHPVSWGVLAERIFEVVYPGMTPQGWDFGPSDIDRGRIGVANDHWLRIHHRHDGMSWTYPRRYGSDAEAATVVAAVLATPLPACQMEDADVQALLDDMLSAPAPMRTSQGEIREVRFNGYVAHAQLDAILHPRGYLWWYGPVTSSVGVHGPTIWIQKRTP